MLFDNLKVLELASVLAGPAVGMFFSELGAKVVKIENQKTGGDVTRTWKLPTEPKDRVSAYFSSVNYGKEHLFMDYKKPDDFSHLQGLIKEADVVICNFKHGDAEKFQLNYERVKELNPEIIYAQLNGFSSIPERVAFDVVLQAECGYMFMNGQPDSPPTKMPLALMDILAAHQLKEGILAALIKKLQTGKGSKVSTSLEESAVSSLANQATNWLMNQHIPQRMGSLHPNIAPYGEVFETKDNKLIVLAIGSNAQFEKFCNIINGAELCSIPEFETNADRVKNRKALQESIAPKVKLLERDPLISECITQHVPVGAVRNMKEVFETSAAQQLILEEQVGDYTTKRVKTVAFKLED